MKKQLEREVRRCLKAGNAADYLGISRRHLHTLSQQGKIPYIKLGARCVVYEFKDLDAFLDEHKIEVA